ncbi:putative G-protein coupled receptor 124 precursor (Tumor endothelial marker 5) (fragment) [Candidatus Methylomirabilis oxygeniifera]|uniref:Putative G-protein coupled receptor 124 (Tumor endothelial marker 5) n=1 Tax=Methylomirabilis oxygeniifera TaxID=671143 RepID=D5MKD9_METO1
MFILTRPPASRNNLVRIKVNLQEDQIYEDTPAIRGQNEVEPTHRRGSLAGRADRHHAERQAGRCADQPG